MIGEVFKQFIVVCFVSTVTNAAPSIIRHVLSGQIAADGSVEISNNTIDSTPKLPPSLVRKAAEGQLTTEGSFGMFSGLVDSTRKLSPSLVRKATEGDVTADGSIEISNSLGYSTPKRAASLVRKATEWQVASDGSIEVSSGLHGSTVKRAPSFVRKATEGQLVTDGGIEISRIDPMLEPLLSMAHKTKTRDRGEGNVARHQLDAGADLSHWADRLETVHYPRVAVVAGSGDSSLASGGVLTAAEDDVAMTPLWTSKPATPENSSVHRAVVMDSHETTLNDSVVSSRAHSLKEGTNIVQLAPFGLLSSLAHADVNAENYEGVRDVELESSTSYAASLLPHYSATAKTALPTESRAAPDTLAAVAAWTSDAASEKASASASAIRRKSPKVVSAPGAVSYEAQASAVQQTATTAPPQMTTTALAALIPVTAAPSTEESAPALISTDLRLIIVIFIITFISALLYRHFVRTSTTSSSAEEAGRNRYASRARSIDRTRSDGDSRRPSSRARSIDRGRSEGDSRRPSKSPRRPSNSPRRSSNDANDDPNQTFTF